MCHEFWSRQPGLEVIFIQTGPPWEKPTPPFLFPLQSLGKCERVGVASLQVQKTYQPQGQTHEVLGP